MTDLLTENARLREALIDATSALFAAISLLSRGSKRAAPSDKMFDQMIADYQASAERARAALATPAPDAPDLTDPVVVHANMLRGTIAKPSVAQIIHLYGSAVFLELLHKLGLCRPTAHDAQSGVYWCAACRNTNAIHCAHPDECGNMRRITRDEIAAQADSWKAWLDDLPLPEFQAAIDGLQDYLTIVVNALFTLNIEDEQPKPPAPDAPKTLPTNCREWFYYPIEMPLSADGQGPATVGVDAAKITYEVWDVLLNTHSSHDHLSDAINEAMRLNLLDEGKPAPDTVQEVAISEVVQHESTRRWFHGEATHEEIMECVKAMDAAVAKWRAIAGDRT